MKRDTLAPANPPPAPELRIGISGWTYAPWRGTFFPGDLRQKDELSYASHKVASIEINGTFYSLQRPTSYVSWAGQTPDDFIFSVKGPRYITHILRLKKSATPLANFFASGVLLLGRKLGPMLWQIPPSLRFDPEILETFLAMLPRTTDAAAEMATHHNEKVRHLSLERGPNQPLRHALEVRHESFISPEFIAVLRRQNVALVVADTAGKWPFLEDTTADFVYVRLHGDSQLYVSGYTDASLQEWARKIRAWHKGGQPSGTKLAAPRVPARPEGRDVYVYFDNDVKIRAPYDAMTLAHFLKIGPKPPPAPPIESISEEPRTVWPGYPSNRARPRNAWDFRPQGKPGEAAARKGKKSSASPRTKSAKASP